MDLKHKNHLLSSQMMLKEHIKQIRDIVCEGHPPTGSGSSLTPLPPTVQSEITGRLEKISHLLDQVGQKYVRAELEKVGRRQPMSATKMWASMQLMRLREIVTDLAPDVFEKKYGPLAPEEKKYLEKVVDEILQEIEETNQFV